MQAMFEGGTTGAEYYYERGNHHFRAGRYRLAAYDYTAAILKKTEHVEAITARALAYAKLGDHTSTIEDLTQVILLRPRDDQAYLLRGAALEAQQRSHEAMSDYGKAIDINPAMIPAYLHRGRVRMRFGNLDGAIRDFDAVLRLDPTHKEGANFRAMADRVRALQMPSLSMQTPKINLIPENHPRGSYPFINYAVILMVLFTLLLVIFGMLSLAF